MPLDLIAGPLHRVVLGEPSIRTGHPLPDSLMLPGRRGRTPTRIARRLTRQRQLTRAMTDSHRAARPTRLTTGASTQLQLPSVRKPDSPSRCQPRPATLPPSPSRSSAELRLPDHGREEIGILRRGRERAERLSSGRGASAPSALQRMVMPASADFYSTWYGEESIRSSSDNVPCCNSARRASLNCPSTTTSTQKACSLN
jgi:hypothetical protein